MYATEHRDLKFTTNGSISLGTFDTGKDGEYILGLWELFMLFLCIIYVRCDLITGACAAIMVSFQFSLVKFLVNADQGETPLFGGNLWTITLYLYLFGWTT